MQITESGAEVSLNDTSQVLGSVHSIQKKLDSFILNVKLRHLTTITK